LTIAQFDCRPASDQAGTFRQAFGDEAHDRDILRVGRNGPDLSGLIQWIAHDNLLHLCRQHILEFGGDAAFNDQAAGRGAALAGVKADAEGRTIGRIFQIAVGKDNDRVLAAQFQTQLLEVRFRRRMNSRPPNGSRPRERQHIDVRMFG